MRVKLPEHISEQNTSRSLISTVRGSSTVVTHVSWDVGCALPKKKATVESRVAARAIKLSDQHRSNIVRTCQRNAEVFGGMDLLVETGARRGSG